MGYNEAINYLYALQKHGIKLGLDNTMKLLSLLGSPQDSFKAVHIAGTNGKGSTSAMIASVLRAAGFRVGHFTSPHVVSFTERIRVDADEIKEEEVVELTEEIRAVIEKTTHHSFLPTFFEFVTAMAFLYFKRKGVDWAVVETGMGGRLDATNILLPRVSVITRIGYDHREFLGGTLAEIAREKAGIIKKGIPVVSSAQDKDAQDVVIKTAEEKEAALFLRGRDFISRPVRSDIDGNLFDYEGRKKFGGLFVPLCGMHQVENASIAVRAIELLMEDEPLPEESLREGLANTLWKGRLELIRGKGARYDVLIDGAHNPDAALALADALKTYFVPLYGKIVLILGIMADKDIEGILAPLLPVASEIIFTAPDYGRAASPEKLSEYAGSLGFNSIVSRSVGEAISVAIKDIGNIPPSSTRHLIAISGSFYTIGEAKTSLGHEGVLARLRE